MTRIFPFRSAAVILPLLLAGCGADAKQPGANAAPQEEAAAMPAGHAEAASGAQSGTVLETIEAASYTYLRVDTSDVEIWLAAPALSIEIGTVVTWSEGMPMQDWHSDTLDRTWEIVYFVASIYAEGSEVDLAAGPSEPSMPEGHPLAAGAETGDIDVPKFEGGSTVAELYASSSELAGKTVAVRGRVVKANFGILGSNWLHIQDGSGDADAATNDVTVTTLQEAAVGDLVIVKGTLVTDKDFGAGYRYAVLIENASLGVER